MTLSPALPIDAELLKEGEVQVWRIELPEEPVAEEDYHCVLSSDERARAARLQPGQVRMQFLVGRNLVRYLLGREMGVSADRISVIAGEYGKPEVVPVKGKAVAFNVAHSRSTILVALCHSGSVGVDIEFVDRQLNVADVCRHAMTASEQRHLLSVADTDDRRRAFFRSWTRKEAIVKADGRGLSLSLNSFQVPMNQERVVFSPVAVPTLGPSGTASYYVSDVDQISGTYAAVATSLQTRNLRFLDLGKAGCFAWK